MKIDLNNIRNRAIDATVSVLSKAKAKPPTTGQVISKMIDDADLSPGQRVLALNEVQRLIKEATNA